MDKRSNSDSFDFLTEDGEVAALMRVHDWTTCPLGPPDNWPQTLINLVSTALRTEMPALVAWGPELICIYNDAYIPFLGHKHPSSFAQRFQDVWAEVWPELAPIVAKAWAGESTFVENGKFHVQRNTSREAIWATFSYSPVMENGVVLGAYNVCIETTAQVVAEKVQRFQLAFTDALRGIADAGQITVVATEMLGNYFHASRVFYSEIDDVNGIFVPKAAWSTRELPDLPGTGRLSDFGDEVINIVRSGRILKIEDIAADPLASAFSQAYLQLQLRALLVVPLVKSGHFIATLVVAHASPYSWTKDDILLVQDAAERTWAAVERARAEMALAVERNRSHDILENMDEGFIFVDRDFRVVQINPAALQLEQRPASEILGRIIWEAWPGLQPSELGQLYQRAMTQRSPVNLQHHYTYPGDRNVWIDMRAYPHGDGMAIFYRDVTESKHAEQRVLEAAQHDPLTGLPNRRLVFEYAGRLLSAAQRSHVQGAFLFIDLDRFKPINDIYGHEVGDRLLQEVAKRLTECVRHEDLVGRLGGDEFIVVLQQGGHDTLSAATVAQHIIDALSYPFEIGTLDLSISACIGISQFPLHGTEVDDLIHAADLAMYQVKHTSRGNYHVYTSELDAHADASSALEARLKRALHRDGLMLHYQPVVDVHSGQVTGVEALLRLVGNGGMIGPDKFIPVAESAGLIGQLGEWVVTEVCRQHAAWHEQGLPPVEIAINVSPLQFRQRGFAQRLLDIVKAARMNPACIQVEVTESAVMSSIDDVIQTLKDIRSGGIRIALDDFGTGYSSLSHLSNLPLDKLKVDQSFVQRIGRDKSSRAITEAIIALGRTLDLEIVGEGIETEDALAYLQEHGCNQAQGFFISRPLSADDFAKWYRKRVPGQSPDTQHQRFQP